MPFKGRLNLYDAGLLVAITTTASYFLSYIYESTFFYYFGIPSYLIEINLNVMLSIMLTFFVSMGFAATISAVVAADIFNGHNGFPLFPLVPAILLSIAGACYSWVGPGQVMFLGVVNFIILTGWAACIGLLVGVKTASASRVKSIVTILLPVLLYAFTIACFSFTIASKKQEFEALKGHADILVVRKYGDEFIGIRVDLNTRKLTGEVLVVKVSDAKPLWLINKHVGTIER